MSATMNLETTLEVQAQPTAGGNVHYVCPSCGDERTGVHVRPEAGQAWVQCDECSYRSHPDVLKIPTEAQLAEWYAHAVRHGVTAVRCADGNPACSYLAVVWCRRLADELSVVGKIGYLDRVARPLTGTITNHQREVVLELGVALRLPPTALNDLLASL